jgi:hypothetical protein
VGSGITVTEGIPVIDEALVYANGVDVTTGGYLIEPMTIAQVASAAHGERADGERIGALTKVMEAFKSDHLGLPFDVDSMNISQAGWAIVFQKDEDAAVKAALQPLIAHRSAQVADERRLKVLDYLSGESRQRWLARHGVAAGNIDPTRVPYYLLIVGSPSKIPFGFCRELAVEYAVGLLTFDAPADYAAYAAGVLAGEKGDVAPRSRRVTFFAPRHDFDAATQLSADRLVKPLAEGRLSGCVGCEFESIWGEQAKREALTEVIMRSDADAPGLLFTASHGMGFPLGHADQRSQQGALLCQNWAGPKAGAVERGQYFAAADVPDTANVAGLALFAFACFGGGTPEHDRFSHNSGRPPRALAAGPFAAALPQRLLAHPRGAALGCIAHIDRAWNHSIVQAGAGPQLIPFENAIGRMLAGQPIGLALKDFNERFAALSVSLAGMIEQIEDDGAVISDGQLAAAWIQRNDAEGYALFGDPAARLRVGKAA